MLVGIPEFIATHGHVFTSQYCTCTHAHAHTHTQEVKAPAALAMARE